MGLCWVWPLKLRKSIWIIMKLHKIRTRFKVTIVLCPSLLKISLWRSEKGHRATWRGKYQQRNQFAAIFNQSDPEWSRPRGRVSQDHSGSLILGVGIVCGTEFRPRVTQDHSGSPRSGGSDRSWNRALKGISLLGPIPRTIQSLWPGITSDPGSLDPPGQNRFHERRIGQGQATPRIDPGFACCKGPWQPK